MRRRTQSRAAVELERRIGAQHRPRAAHAAVGLRVAQRRLAIVDLQAIAIDDGVIRLIKEELAKKYTAIPIEVENRTTLRVAMADPLNAAALEDLRFQSGYFVRPVLAPPTEIVEAISRYYHIDASVVEILENIIKNDPISEVREIVEAEPDESLDGVYATTRKADH